MKKKSLLLIILLLVVTLTIGASYALWQATHKQNEKNTVSIGCFSLESDIGTNSEQSPISLMDAMPISDAQGMSLTPFTFTLTNTCSMYATYQVNLETLSTTTLGADYLKVALSNNTPAILSSYESVTPTITDATSSNKLITGGLRKNESVTYDLRLWLDSTTPRAEGSNKIYNGKISITASPKVDDTAVATITNLVKGEPTNTLDVITKEAPSGATCTNTLGYDNTTENNLRYVGSDPCNYVSFNNELWRIIGVMNNIDDGSGKVESRLKLIRKDSLGGYSWDSTTSSASATEDDPAVNSGHGINQWGKSTNYVTGEAYQGADLMQELNGDYLDLTLTENTTWYNGENNTKTAEFNYTTRLNESAQFLIEKAKWNTSPANSTNVGTSDILTQNAYADERSNTTSATNYGKYCPNTNNGCNDNIERTLSWIGKVGLIYPSDLGYATSGSTTDETYTRERCINEVPFSQNKYNDATYGNCGTNSWIRKGGGWTMTSYADSNYSYFVFAFFNSGFIGNHNHAYAGYDIRPSVYLKSNVKITGGDGSINNPYTLGI